jgi:hypothetical protein
VDNENRLEAYFCIALLSVERCLKTDLVPTPSTAPSKNLRVLCGPLRVLRASSSTVLIYRVLHSG